MTAGTTCTCTPAPGKLETARQPPRPRLRDHAGCARLGAESVLTRTHTTCRLPAETARWSTITQVNEGTNQIQRMVMARQLLKG